MSLGSRTTVDHTIWVGTFCSRKQVCIRSNIISQLPWYEFSSLYASSIYSFRCSALTLDGPGDFPFFNPRIALAISAVIVVIIFVCTIYTILCCYFSILGEWCKHVVATKNTTSMRRLCWRRWQQWWWQW